MSSTAPLEVLALEELRSLPNLQRVSGRRPDAAELRRAVATRIPALPHPTSGFRRDQLEGRCRAHLGSLRWPAGVSCPRCDEPDRLLWLESRSKWHCYACRYQFSVTAGTLFHRSHLPLWKWFASILLMLDSDGGTPALELADRLGGSYKSYWFTAHRIRIAMMNDPRSDGNGRRARRTGGTKKYRSAYEGEQRFRRAYRGNPCAFTSVLCALLDASPISYGGLVGRG